MDENLPHIDPSEWPTEPEPLTDEEALIVAMLILDGRPRSYVEGAKRLARYVLDLNLQIEGRSNDIAEFVQHDTEVPNGTFTEEERKQVTLTAVDD